jgi:hypothetical protein
MLAKPFSSLFSRWVLSWDVQISHTGWFGSFFRLYFALFRMSLFAPIEISIKKNEMITRKHLQSRAKMRKHKTKKRKGNRARMHACGWWGAKKQNSFLFQQLNSFFNPWLHARPIIPMSRIPLRFMELSSISCMHAVFDSIV